MVFSVSEGQTLAAALIVGNGYLWPFFASKILNFTIVGDPFRIAAVAAALGNL